MKIKKTCLEIVEYFGAVVPSSITELPFYGHNLTFGNEDQVYYVESKDTGERFYVSDMENVDKRYV